MGIMQRFDRNYPCGVVGCPYRTATHWHEITLEMVPPGSPGHIRMLQNSRQRLGLKPLPFPSKKTHNTQGLLESNIRRYELKPRFPYRFWTLLIVFVLLLVTKFSTI